MNSIAILIRVFIGITLLGIFLGCSNDKEPEKSDHQLIREELLQKKLEAQRALSKDYIISYTWDTLELEYSILYQNLIKEGSQIVEQPHIDDILIEDSLSYVIVTVNDFIFKLLIDDDQQEKLLNLVSKYEVWDITDHLSLIITINQIEKVLLRLVTTDCSWEFFETELQDSDTFYGHGVLEELIYVE